DMPGAARATGFMVAVGDDGASGIPVGCGDSLIDVTIPIWETDSLEEEIAATLTVLLSYDDADFGESGLTNALFRNEATVESVTLDGSAATVNLSGSIPSGGVCDDPRIKGQLEETVKAFDGVDAVVILLNGNPIFPAP
ncbi:MAG: GerMN domain-containing protein, partial [Chloroflexota bacterium]|nr:GerMN domain-containing protein [Chloroflexota bacterium]